MPRIGPRCTSQPGVVADKGPIGSEHNRRLASELSRAGDERKACANHEERGEHDRQHPGLRDARWIRHPAKDAKGLADVGLPTHWKCGA